MPSPTRRVLEVEERGDVTVVKFCDRNIMDEQTIRLIGEQLMKLVDEQGKRNLALHFDNVEYLASLIVAKLVAVKKKLDAVGGKLTFCHVDPQIYKIFEISRLDKYFDVKRAEGSGGATEASDGA